MKHNKLLVSSLSFVALIVFLSLANAVSAQERGSFSKEAVEAAKKAEQEASRMAAPQPTPPAVLGCRGPITQVIDLGDENLRFTPAIFGTSPGGGEGGQFDKTPLLSTKVNLVNGTCLDAHLSAFMGSKLTYGVSRMAFFQVTLTPPGGGHRHIVGHYERCFGWAPCVALEAERDAEMYASNFFQRVGNGPHEVPPGIYRVDVWWAGGPDPGGALGAAFVLKLYLR